MLVARHFVQYGEWLWRGPLTGGGNQLLLNSPAFYYLLSILWMLTRSPYGMMVAWMMLFSSIIYFVYRTAKNLWDWKTGIIAATITAIHPEYIFFSR